MKEMRSIIPNDYARCTNEKCPIKCKRREQVKIDSVVKVDNLLSYTKFNPTSDNVCDYKIEI